MGDPGERCLQERYAPHNRCFGCGPANEKGLRIRSFPTSDGPDAEVVAEWTPDRHHEAFEGMLNGGIIGALLDCQCNWSAAYHFMRARGSDHPPVTVTADYTIRLRKPTPAGEPVRLRSWIAEATDRKAIVEAELSSGGEVTATCSGTFVPIGESHPAHGAW